MKVQQVMQNWHSLMFLIIIKLGSIISISFSNDAKDTKVCKSSLWSKKLLNIEALRRQKPPKIFEQKLKKVLRNWRDVVCLFEIKLGSIINMSFLHYAKDTKDCKSSKDQENPNFTAFDQFGSLTNNPVFEPGALGKCSDGTEIVCKASSLKS